MWGLLKSFSRDCSGAPACAHPRCICPSAHTANAICRVDFSGHEREQIAQFRGLRSGKARWQRHGDPWRRRCLRKEGSEPESSGSETEG
eukprot:2185175-Rhodomonas_salina.1